MNIQQTNLGAVPSVNTSNPGPSVFLTAAMDGQGNVTLETNGYVDNQAGQVSVTVADGSLIQAGSINATQVNVSTQSGITVFSDPSGLSGNAGTPATEWQSDTDWPDGYDPYTSGDAASLLASVYVAYVANAMYNNDPDYGITTDDTTFTQELLGYAGEVPTEIVPGAINNFEFPSTLSGELATVYDYDNSAESVSSGYREPATSLIFFGADAPWNVVYDAQDTEASASALSPADGYYRISSSNATSHGSEQGYFPLVPVETVNPTTAAYPTLTGSLTLGSDVVTGLSNSSGIEVGEYLTGNGVAPGTTIASVNPFDFNAYTTAGSPMIESAGFFEPFLAVGETVTGPGIPSGATIESFGTFNGFFQPVTLSLPATTTNTLGVTLTAITSVTLSSPATVTGTESLAVGTGSSINADDVYINALYVDINEPINVGQSSNWSVSLPSSLNSTIAEDQSDYAAGIYSKMAGDAQGYYTLPVSTVSPGDTLDHRSVRRDHPADRCQ